MKKLNYLTIFGLLICLASCEKTFVAPTINLDKLNIILPATPMYRSIAPKEINDEVYFDFYEISDFHGAISETSTNLGFSKFASYMNLKRQDNDGGTFLISGGDMFQGSFESYSTKGQIISYCMNYIGFDCMTLGNHEFDYSDKRIKENLAISSFPYLAINLRNKNNELPSFVKPSEVYTAGDYKIGIIGSIGHDIESSITKTSLSDYSFVNENELVKNEASRLRTTEGCNIVIWTCHYDIEKIMQNYDNANTLGVDAVFGGHSHNDLNRIQGNGVTAIPYLETDKNGQSVAHVQIVLDKNTKQVLRRSGEVDSSPKSLSGISQNTDIDNICSQYNNSIAEIKKIKIGKADKELSKSHLARLCAASIYNSITKWAKKNNENLPVVAFNNTESGIRAVIKAGEVTYGQIYESFPFDNEIVLVQMNGSKLKARIKAAPEGSIALYHKFTSYDQIDINKDYWVAIADHVATSVNYPFNFNEDDFVHTGVYVRDVVLQTFYNNKIVKRDDYKSNISNYIAIPE